MSARLLPPVTADEPAHCNPAQASALLVGRAEAARALGIGTTLLDELIATRQLPAVRLGRRVLIHRDDLEAFAAALRRATTTTTPPTRAAKPPTGTRATSSPALPSRPPSAPERSRRRQPARR